MSTAAQEIKHEGMGSHHNPVLSKFEEALSRYIGVLSRFIVHRQYERVSPGGSMTEENAKRVSGYIVEEASLLIGSARTEELRNIFGSIIHELYKEEQSDG